MIQKQIFFLNTLIISVSIIFIIIFFIPIFTINIPFPLNYKIRDNNLVINIENLNMGKILFMKFKNNSIVKREPKIQELIKLM
jgi:hypothetical protein